MQVQEEARHYQKELMEEINKDRDAHGKKPFDDDGSGKGASGGPRRKYIRITANGRTALRELAEEWNAVLWAVRKLGID